MPLIKPKVPVILLAFANERSENGFLRKLTVELKNIMRALEYAVQKDRCQLKIIPAATQEEIAEVFQDEWYEGRVWIFHYGGHADENELWLESASGGNQSFFSLGLAKFLGAQKGLKLVFLNGCATLDHAQLMLDAGIPAVIATSRKIADDQAVEFSTLFYKGMASGAGIQEAFDEAQGILLGKYGPDSFKPEQATRSLNWQDQTLTENIDLPWRLFIREENSWMASQWRLFYELKEEITPGEEIKAEAFIGQTINNYEVVDLLGLGSMGNVYKARHKDLNEERAIKITHPITEGYELFRSIIIAGNKGLAALRHPNVVTFYDVGELVLFGEKRLYIVMELVKGQRMDEMNLGPLLDDPKQVEALTDLAIQVASGLEAAHTTRFVDEAGLPREGIVHGNIKTRKIMFTPEGVPKLIDFMFTDLSRSNNIKLALPEAVKQMMRSERPELYLPPEVLRGDSPVNKLSDIYGLGAVFFEVASGQSVADVSFNSEDELYRFIRERHRNFPRHLAGVIYDATQSDPGKRFQKVGEMIDGLLNYSSLRKRLLYWFRRKKFWPPKKR